MKNERVAIYIDGGNTYKRLKEVNLLRGGKIFDYSALAEYLVGDRELVSKRYYIGIVKI